MRLVNFSEKELYETLGFFIVIAIALLTFGLFSKNNLLVNASVAIGTIAMAVFIAYQAFITRRSIEEIRKDRMDIESIKNEIVGYIDLIEDMLKFNLTEAHPQGMAGNEIPSYSSQDSPNITLQERGMKLRIHNKIQKLLKNYGMDLKPYNELVKKINADTAEIIKKLETDEVLVDLISRKSKEVSGKWNKKRIPGPKDVIRELVLQFKEDITKMDAPRYERLGLDIKVDQTYRLDLWDTSKKILVEYLRNNNVQAYNKLIEREKDIMKLKPMTRELLEKVRKMKEELLQSEEILEEKLMRL